MQDMQERSNPLPEILKKLGKADPVGILSVGTEITRGEILNRNSKWLSENLDASNLRVILHIAVPDDRENIKLALNTLSECVKHIFVTGGLGPTTDDFTRNVIADWSGCKLEYDLVEEEKVQKILSQRNVTFKESHKQQCFFPERAAILENRAGTASGFAMKVFKGECISLWAFPGPPHELKSVFKIALDEHLQSLSALASSQFFAYRVLGLPESEVADSVEQLFAGLNCELAYRASSPFVIVKILTQVNSPAFAAALLKFEKMMGEFLVSKSLEDPVKSFLAELSKYGKVKIQDRVSQHYLTERFSGFREELKLLKEFEIVSSPHIHSLAQPAVESQKGDSSPNQEAVVLSLIQNTGEWEAAIAIYKTSEGSDPETIPTMFKSQVITPFSRYKFGSEFGIRYVAEKSILFWTQALRSRSSYP